MQRNAVIEGCLTDVNMIDGPLSKSGLGHERQIDDVTDVSVAPPIASKFVRCTTDARGQIAVCPFRALETAVSGK